MDPRFCPPPAYAINAYQQSPYPHAMIGHPQAMQTPGTPGWINPNMPYPYYAQHPMFEPPPSPPSCMPEIMACLAISCCCCFLAEEM